MDTIRPFLILLAFLGTSALGCRKADESGKPEKERPPVPVRVVKAEQRTLRPGFEVVGTVMPDPGRMATLTAATPGLVTQLTAAEGARVTKGQLIVRLDERKARLDVDRAKAALARLVVKPRLEEVAVAEALIAKATAAHAVVRTRLDRGTALRARDASLVPEVQILDDQRAEEIAAADLAAAQAQLRLLQQGPRPEQRREAEVEIRAMRLQLGFCRVTTPFAGEVVELLARVGLRADVGTPLARIIDTSEVLVQARVPGNRLTGVLAVIQATSKESLAEIRSPSFPGEVFLPQSAWLNQQTEALTSDVPIKLRVPNPKGLLRVGLAVQVVLHEPGVEGVAIPEAALAVNEEGHKVVTLIKDGKAVPTEIEVESETEPEVRVGGWVRVLKGVAVGDAVAVENGYALPKDTPVVVLPPEAPKPTAGH